MRKCIERREFIPVAESPAEMPKGIAIHYYIRWPDRAKEITPASLSRLKKNLRDGKWKNVFLCDAECLEVNFMQLESGGGLYALQFVQDNTGGIGEEAAWFSVYDPEHLESEEEPDIESADGQAVIYRGDVTTDKEAVMTAIEYFIRTGKLWDGIPWMKSWQEWAEERSGE